MQQALDTHLLSFVTFAPLGVALGLLALSLVARFLGTPALPDGLWKTLALAATLLNFALSLRIAWAFDPISTDFQFVEYVPWLPDYGIHHFVGIDGINLFLVVLTTFLLPIALLACWNDISVRVKSYVFFMLVLETGMLGAFVSLNAFEFYVFWEVMLVPMFFLIGIWGGPQRVYAAVKFVLFNLFGSVLMLVALVVVSLLAYEQTGGLSFDLVAPPGGGFGGLIDTLVPAVGEDVWWRTDTWLFAAFALAFTVKIPLVPLHTWLPDAQVQAPTAASVILAGVLLEMGAYGLLRFALPLFPHAAAAFAPWMLCIGVIGIIYGSLVAMAQSDVKRLVAYSSVAHMGFVVIGIFVSNVQGLAGGVLQMVNHGITTGALFILVGFLYERRHTREIADFGGVAKPMPVFAAYLGIAVMASIGLPLLNGFVGELLILVGAFLVSPVVAVCAAFGGVLAAATLLWMFRRVALGPVEHPENRSLIDLNLREKVVMFALVVPIFWIGIQPSPFLRRIEPSVIELLHHVDRARRVSQPKPAPKAPVIAPGEAAS